MHLKCCRLSDKKIIKKFNLTFFLKEIYCFRILEERNAFTSENEIKTVAVLQGFHIHFTTRIFLYKIWPYLIAECFKQGEIYFIKILVVKLFWSPWQAITESRTLTWDNWDYSAFKRHHFKKKTCLLIRDFESFHCDPEFSVRRWQK